MEPTKLTPGVFAKAIATLQKHHVPGPYYMRVSLLTVGKLMDKRELRSWRRKQGMSLRRWKASLNLERQERRRGTYTIFSNLPLVRYDA